MRAGFAGEEAPRSVFRSIVGRTSSDVGHPGLKQIDCYIGEEALYKPDNMKISYPIEYGFINSWDDMDKIWHHCFYNELRAEPNEHHVLLTEKPWDSTSPRYRTTQIMFETFSVKAA